MKKLIKIQFIILLGGTLFAWGNFFTEFLNWLSKKACSTGCAANPGSPFLTPCFWGAVFFTIAFILNVMIVKRSSKNS